MHLGRPHLEVKTVNATYLLDKGSGGFSSIKDHHDVEWIGFKLGERQVPVSAAADFRGMPNLVHKGEDDGAGHPGFDQCISSVKGNNQITVESNSGKWEWRYTFSDEGVLLDILKVDQSRNYWFLYEGTPGGRFDPKHQYWGNNVDGLRLDFPPLNPNLLAKGTWDWAFFGHKEVPNTLFIIQLTPDTVTDNFAYMGHSKKGVESEDGMIVFGLGRSWGSPLMNEKNTFFIGFKDFDQSKKKSFRHLKKHIAGIVAAHRN